MTTSPTPSTASPTRRARPSSTCSSNGWAEDQFRRGVQDYLRKYSDRTATAKDFLESLSTGAGRDMTSAFSTFLDQAGVPEIQADLRCGDGKASVALSQKHGHFRSDRQEIQTSGGRCPSA